MRKHYRSFRFLLLLALLSLAACSHEGTRPMPDLTTQAKIDLPRYMGAWHVIANIPYFGEKGDVASRDVYTLDKDGRVQTTYFYRKAFDAPEKSLDSVGIVQPGSDNARWIVRFFWLFRADYLILEVAPDYSWVLVGQPSRKLGWVLARDAAMSDDQYATLLQKFAGYGYDTRKFARIPQFAEQLGKPGFQ